MKNIEKSTPLTVVMKLYAPAGGDYALAGLQYSLWHRSSAGLKQVKAYTAAPDGSAISYTFPEGALSKTGYYSLILELKNPTTDRVMNKIVFENAFAVYPEGYVKNDGTLATTSQDGSTVITLGAIAEFGVFSKEVPIYAGLDGFWYANLDGEGVRPLRDAEGKPIPTTHQITYDSETMSIWIDRGIIDPDGNEVEQEIHVVGDAVREIFAKWDEAYTSWNMTFIANEGTRDGSVAGDGSRWGDFKTTIANFTTEHDGLVAYYRQVYDALKDESIAATNAANTAAARAEAAVSRAEEVISKAVYAEEVKTVETPTDMITATKACVEALEKVKGVEAAEALRSEAETQRSEAESARLSAETSRISAETARLSAETDRQQNETNRQAAESQRDAIFASKEATRDAANAAALNAAEKLTELEGDIADINDELHPKITHEETIIVPVDTSARRNVNITTGEFVSTTSQRYAIEFALDGTEVEISVPEVANFAGNYGYAFLDANGSVVLGKKELGEKPLVIDPTIPISNGAVILRVGMMPNTTATIKRVQTEQTDVLADLESRVEALEERPVGDASPAVVSSAIGGKAGVYKADTLSGTDELIAEDFPTGNKKGDRYNFTCDVTSFNGIYVCKGLQTTYGGRWFHIDSTSVTLYGMGGTSQSTIEQVSHQLQIESFLYVNVMITDEGVAKFVLKTKGGEYAHDFNGWGLNSRGTLKIANDGSSLANCILTANNVYFKSPIWYFGASWEGVDDARVFGQLRTLGYFNFLANAWTGRSGTQMFNDFKLALNFGMPRMLIAIIANMQIDTEAQINAYKNLFNSIKALCEEKGIELIVRTHPNTDAKNYDVAINPFILSSGVRIVDYYKAMKDPNKTWVSGTNDCYDGYMDSTSHPTTAGAQALALRVLADIPEIMML